MFHKHVAGMSKRWKWLTFCGSGSKLGSD